MKVRTECMRFFCCLWWRCWTEAGGEQANNRLLYERNNKRTWTWQVQSIMYITSSVWFGRSQGVVYQFVKRRCWNMIARAGPFETVNRVMGLQLRFWLGLEEVDGHKPMPFFKALVYGCLNFFIPNERKLALHLWSHKKKKKNHVWAWPNGY